MVVQFASMVSHNHNTWSAVAVAYFSRAAGDQDMGNMAAVEPAHMGRCDQCIKSVVTVDVEYASSSSRQAVANVLRMR
jgi:hypothetical protein